MKSYRKRSRGKMFTALAEVDAGEQQLRELHAALASVGIEAEVNHIGTVSRLDVVLPVGLGENQTKLFLTIAESARHVRKRTPCTHDAA